MAAAARVWMRSGFMLRGARSKFSGFVFLPACALSPINVLISTRRLGTETCAFDSLDLHQQYRQPFPGQAGVSFRWELNMAAEFRLLKEIIKKREVTIKQLREMAPNKFGDHRDYYEIAGLITGGYLECTMHKQGDRKQIEGATAFDYEEIWFSQMKEFEVAREIYSMTFGPGEHEYLGTKYLNPPPILDERIFPTGKAFLHFNSERQTRNDRIAALAIGIIVGIVTAAATVYLTRIIHDGRVI